jgi:hypothetical protein
MFNIMRVIIISMVGLIMFSCSQKKEKQSAEQDKSASQGTMSTKTVGIKAPNFLKGKWKSVKIAVYDKKTMQESIYDINIGSSTTLLNSDISIEVNYFFPHYILSGTDHTSESNELKNPAAQITVSQGTANVIKGWLFGNYPDMSNKFFNDRIAMRLIGAEATK